MIKRIFITSLLSVILTAVCVAQSDPLNFVQTGTATHEIDSDDLVAGHSILPIGQEVTVTNLESGAQVTVTITDRIPQTSSRIIDLSAGAAAAIAMFDETVQVTIEAELRRAEPEAPAPVPASSEPTPAPTASPAPAAASVPAPDAAPPAPAVSPAPAVASAPVPAEPTPASAVSPAPAAASVPVPAEPTPAPAVSPAPAVADATPVPYTVPPPPPGPIPTSEIEPIVPPWETGPFTPWPVQPNDPLLPELAQPWISGIEKPKTTGPAQIPAPQAVPPPRAVQPHRTAPPPVQRGPSVNVIPQLPGPGDNTLYRVQIGAFKTRLNAEEVFNRLLTAGFSPVFEVGGGLTRVLIPWIRGYEVQALGERLYREGFREVWLREES
ncbi:MAG: SPOR domain-containing protein [Treponema sp.]|jgi:hypothetical protein|nr:SPOR domain-containing protein [Treponema sp.]